MHILNRLFRWLAFSFFARRFVAGDTVEDAIRRAKQLEAQNILGLINILGEHASKPCEASGYKGQYLELLDAIHKEGLRAHISVKLTQLGLELELGKNEKRCEQFLKDIAKRAETYGIWVEVDRESPHLREAVRRVFRNVYKEYPENLRLTVQLNMAESPDEIHDDMMDGIPMRLCKGAYNGPIRDQKSLRKIFMLQARNLVWEGYKPAFATHDLALLDALIDGRTPAADIEFQLLLGLENKYARMLAARGFRVRLYIPYGPSWLPYGKRRAHDVGKILWRNFWYRARRKFFPKST